MHDKEAVCTQEGQQALEHSSASDKITVSSVRSSPPRVLASAMYAKLGLDADGTREERPMQSVPLLLNALPEAAWLASEHSRRSRKCTRYGNRSKLLPTSDLLQLA